MAIEGRKVSENASWKLETSHTMTSQEPATASTSG
jgi:hypothetical protein